MWPRFDSWRLRPHRYGESAAQDEGAGLIAVDDLLLQVMLREAQQEVVQLLALALV